MGFIDRFIKRMQFDYCKPCKTQMRVIETNLYFLPISAGAEFDYDTDIENLTAKFIPIESKDNIKKGFHFAYTKVYRCSFCGKRIETIEIVLPAGNQELVKRIFIVESGTVAKIKTIK